MKASHNLGQIPLALARDHITHLFKSQAHDVHTRHWQAVDISARREARMKELLNVSFTSRVEHLSAPGDAKVERLVWAKALGPNLPWANKHFDERVCGYPINPGEQWALWPWGGSADTFRDHYGQFNHNYMERFWPKHAPIEPCRFASEVKDPTGPVRRGIRNEYGDLMDLVQQLVEEPDTRQAWFPIFHPEDVGNVVGGRKPCTLGYQFTMREDLLHIYYPLRSCDFHRHWADDAYMTLLLGQWLVDQCSQRSENWSGVRVGSLTMHCVSLHMFINDWHQLHIKGA